MGLGLIAVGLVVLIGSWFLGARSPGLREVVKGKPIAVGGEVITVAKQGPADRSSLADALRDVQPGQTIRVIDSETYDEPVRIAGPGLGGGIRLESTSRAVLKARAERSIVDIDDVANVVVSGFRIEADEGQCAVEIRGACPGLLIEDCEISRSAEAPAEGLAVVFLHAGASGTAEAPIRLSRLVVRSASVGIVIGENDALKPVSHVELTDSRLSAREKRRGIPLILQIRNHHVTVRGNLISSGFAGISFAFKEPRAATEVVVAGNSIGDVDHGFAINDSVPDQGLTVAENLIVDASTVHLDMGSVGPFAGWFRANWWERGPNFDAGLAAIFPPPGEPLTFLSRDPASGNYLKPAGDQAPGWPGKYPAATKKP